MPDCANSISTPVATPTTPDPHAAALRHAGHLLYDLVTDGKLYDPEPAESSTHYDLAAALVDLRYMESYLADIGRWPQER